MTVKVKITDCYDAHDVYTVKWQTKISQFMARQQIKNNKNANSTEYYTLQAVPAELLMDY